MCSPVNLRMHDSPPLQGTTGYWAHEKGVITGHSHDITSAFHHLARNTGNFRMVIFAYIPPKDHLCGVHALQAALQTQAARPAEWMSSTRPSAKSWPWVTTTPGWNRVAGKWLSKTGLGLLVCRQLAMSQPRWPRRPLVRPYLESCQVVWASHYKEDTDVLECVLRRAKELGKGLEHRWEADEGAGAV